MTESTVTRVVLYAYATGTPLRAAEFRLGAGGEVRLIVFDQRWSRVARQYADHGVPSDVRGRSVRPEEGVAFLRALLEPRQMSYYQFVDESQEAV